MCGIAGVYFHNAETKLPITRKQLENLVNELLLGIEHRGRHSTGIATMLPNGKTTLEKRPEAATSFIQKRGRLPRRPQAILLHTRFATKGDKENNKNNHPIRNGSCLITHNGHISNDDELFGKHSLPRYGEVDSEIIAALFDKHGIDKAHLALQELDGNYAVAVIDERKPGTLVLAKGWSSPLYTLEFEGEGIIWASTLDVIQKACEKALGFKPAASAIKSYTPGDLLLVEDGKVDKLDFVPLAQTTSWSSRGTSSDGWSGSYRSGSYSYEGRWSSQHTTFCTCGCKQFWHAGANGDGMCLSRGCKCEEFTSKKKAEVATCSVESKDSVPCDDVYTDMLREAEKKAVAQGRHDAEDEREITVHRYDTESPSGRKETFRLCDNCEHGFVKETMVGQGGWWFCKPCMGITATEEPEVAGLGGLGKEDRAALADGYNVTEQDVEAAHELAIEEAADQCGVSVMFVEWILDAEDDLVMGDTYLSQKRPEVEQAYSDLFTALIRDGLKVIGYSDQVEVGL